MKKLTFLLIVLMGLVFSACTEESSSTEDAVAFDVQSWVKEADSTDNCAYDFELPVFQMESIDTQIKATVLKNILLGDAAYSGESIEDGVNEFLTNCREDSYSQTSGLGWYINITGELTQNQDGILSILINWNSFSGGAHPNYGFESLIFDMETGKQLTIEDLIIPERMAEFSVMLGDRLTAEAVDYPGGFNTDVYDPHFVTDYGTFYLTPEELSVVYDPYEILPYVAAAMGSATFSREELDGFLDF